VVELVTLGRAFCDAIGQAKDGKRGAARPPRHDLHFDFDVDQTVVWIRFVVEASSLVRGASFW